MEQLEGISEGEWSYLSSMYTAEEADFMAQLLTNSCIPTESEGTLAFGVQSLWPTHESNLTNTAGNNRCSYYSTHVCDSTNFSSFTQGTSSSGSLEDYLFSDNNTVDVLLTDNGISSYIVDGNVEEPDPDYQEKSVLLDENFKPIADYETPVLEDSAENKSDKKERSAKRARSSLEIPKCKRNVKSRKSPKAFVSNNEEENAGTGRKNSSDFCSEDEPNASRELNGGNSSSLSPTEAAPTNLNVKTRATRGAATDPQSLYARKRRERINERLRILQTLVPNGTKVDMSTMLEEAVQYVKFLQTQIKLLSSDDLWMYAPIAYNGMDVGLDLNIIPPTKLP